MFVVVVLPFDADWRFCTFPFNLCFVVGQACYVSYPNNKNKKYSFIFSSLHFVVVIFYHWIRRDRLSRWFFVVIFSFILASISHFQIDLCAFDAPSKKEKWARNNEKKMKKKEKKENDWIKSEQRINSNFIHIMQSRWLYGSKSFFFLSLCSFYRF